MSGRFIGYFRLIDACGEPGCPVCRCVRDDSARHLTALLSEHVTDPETRAALRAARGFCNWHAAMLRDIPDAGFAVAILSADLIAAEGVRAGRLRAAGDGGTARLAGLGRLLGAGSRRPGRNGRTREGACLTCRTVRDGEARYLREMLGSVGRPDFDAAFDHADGLCRPHLARLADLAEARSASALERLIEQNRAKWRRLEGVLRRFIEKHDHRRRAPLTEEEARSWRLALELLAGAPGVFGDDARGVPPAARGGLRR